MTFTLLTNIVSPHQLPFSKEIAKAVGEENLRYVYIDRVDECRSSLGWSCKTPSWGMFVKEKEAAKWIEESDVLVSGQRSFELFKRRYERGYKNFYMSERWLKPPFGIIRLLFPRYFSYVRSFVKLLDEDKVIYLAVGVSAARDMARLCGLMHGDLRCLIKAPVLDFESKPLGKIWIKNKPINTRMAQKFCLDQMRMWGYFVAPSQYQAPNDQTPKSPNHNSSTLKVLWVGRMQKLKRVDSIIRAVGELATRPTCTERFTLDIYGTGPEERNLRKLAEKYCDTIKFYPPVPIDEVRKLMHEHDVYVLASNGYEGWGAVVSEALEEGMVVFGSNAAGSCATMLPVDSLFNSGDWRRLAQLLLSCKTAQGIGPWTAKNACEQILKECSFNEKDNN